MTDTDSLQLARTALETHDWQGAYDAYVAASIDLELSGDDLQRLAEAAWWTAHPKECIDALERAYAAYSREGNPRRAAYVALHLAEQCSERLQSAQAAGWFQRASRLLEGQPESVEHGYLAARHGDDLLRCGGSDASTVRRCWTSVRASTTTICRRSG